MRKTILISIAIVLSALTAQAQTWEYGESSNKFENFSFGFAGVIGSGEFPYSNPSFGLRKSSNFGLEIMLINIAYTPDKSTVKMYVDSGKVHEVNFNTSDDNQSIFFEFGDFESEFINLLKSGSKLYIRVYTGSGSNDYTFSLSGSTATIKKVLIYK